ncbi:putative membrane protein [Bacillus capparidis]|uniref:Membrane protein n=1 Tax=Bacillus capparidis TaxID=1840411 RepID=A0ABS4D2H0_9BACI|nr:putative membrane protein [Bacillus capparidis]
MNRYIKIGIVLLVSIFIMSMLFCYIVDGSLNGDDFFRSIIYSLVFSVVFSTGLKLRRNKN